MLKRSLSLIFAMFLMISTISIVFASNEPRIVISSTSAMPGDTIVLSVKLENNPGINSFSFGFDYDTTMLKLEKVNASSNIGGQFAYKTRAVWISSKDINYNGEIMNLTFKVLDKANSGVTRVSISYMPGEISNYNEEDVNFTVVSGQVSVGISQSMLSKIIAVMRRILDYIRHLFNF